MPAGFGDRDMGRQTPMRIVNFAVHFAGDAQYHDSTLLPV
jgi:hypothetical protein